MKIKLLSLMFVAGVATTSCKKDRHVDDTINTPINEISAPADFTWSGARDVRMSIGITDSRFQDRIHVIKIYTADPAKGGELISKGSATLIMPFNTKVFLNSQIKQVYVEKISPDGGIVAQTLALTSNDVSVAIGSQAVMQSSASKTMTTLDGMQNVNLVNEEASPACTGTLVTTGSFDMNSGQTYRLGTNGQSVNIGNENGGTLYICATGVTVNDFTLNSNMTLIITDGASVTFNNFNWQNGGTFKNFGTATIQNYYFNIPSSGNLLNQGIMTINQGVDAAGPIVNTGTLTVNANMFKIRDNGNFTNQGTFSTTGEIAAQANITNSGPFTVDGKLISERVFTNAASGVVRIKGSSSALQNSNSVFSNAGQVTFDQGNVTITNSFSNSGTVKFTGGEVNFNNNPTFTNSGVIEALTSKMNATGNLTNSGSITVRELTYSGNGTLTNSCKFIVKTNADIDRPIVNSSYFRVEGDVNFDSNAPLTLGNNAMFYTNTASNLDSRIYGPTLGDRALFKVTGNVDNNNVSNSGVLTFSNRLDFCYTGNQTIPAGVFSNGAVESCSLVLPITACNPVGNNTTTAPSDRDGDGVSDLLDDYPDDDQLVHRNEMANYGAGGYTVAFEDSWPLKGDYDLNDIVIRYRYVVATNKDNKVVKVFADYTLIATGGTFQNGAGIEFPVAASSLVADSVKVPAGVSLESGQDKVVIILFNNSREQQATWNTESGQPSSPEKSFSISFRINNGPHLDDFGIGNYNPFIWNNSAGFGRGYETHLYGKTPTNKANTSLFGTGDDRSNINIGKYYGTANNLPWAIMIPTHEFKYPIERAPITDAYKKFADWAISGGFSSENWFSGEGPAFRDDSKLY